MKSSKAAALLTFPLIAWSLAGPMPESARAATADASIADGDIEASQPLDQYVAPLCPCPIGTDLTGAEVCGGLFNLYRAIFEQRVVHRVGDVVAFRAPNGVRYGGAGSAIFGVGYGELSSFTRKTSVRLVGALYGAGYAACGAVPLYAYRNPINGSAFYTSNPAVGRPITGSWIPAESPGYCFLTQVPGSIPLYGYYNPEENAYLYTTDFSEMGEAANGFVLIDTPCYIYGLGFSSSPTPEPPPPREPEPPPPREPEPPREPPPLPPHI